ncbi:MAG: PIG-L deacetylase family protein [Candidatus Omnitrophota bacterium]|jgi:LmbE family N-acetylglucosaminyl deacetylase
MNILAISPHPDDLEFGCGGTLLKYSRAGHKVFLLVLTPGGVGGEPVVRMKEQERSAAYIGAKKLFWGGFTDTEMVDNRDLILKIEDTVKKTSPDIVLMNYIDDTHQDHRAAAHAGISATRHIKEVMFYESPTSQGFEPDIFVDVTAIVNNKLKLLKIHASQINKVRIKNLGIVEIARSCMNFRGFQGRVKFAEAYKGVRILKKIE